MDIINTTATPVATQATNGAPAPGANGRSGQVLTEAFHQWANRPADQRFENLEALLANAKQSAQESKEYSTRWTSLHLVPRGAQGLALATDPSSQGAAMTHWAFSQFCSRFNMPAAFLRTLAPSTAAQCLEDMKAKGNFPGGSAELYTRSNGKHEVRAVTTDKYSRILDADIIQRLTKLESDGWQVPPARPYPGAKESDPGVRRATSADVLKSEQVAGLSIREGQLIAPAGLYRSDRDMFAFLVNEQEPIIDPQGNPLFKGFFVANSEVGSASFRMCLFYYRAICGNHIVWDAEKVTDLRIRHVGNAWSKGMEKMRWKIQAAERTGANRLKTEERLKYANSKEIAASKDDLLDAVFGMRTGLTKSTIQAAYDHAHDWRNVDGDPRTYLGFTNALTRYSQTMANADQRADIDTSAGKVLAKCPF